MSQRGEQEDDYSQSERVPLSAVFDIFEAREDRARPLTATDIMEALDCSRRTAHNKLNELVDEGVLETRKVGSRSRVWWIPIQTDGDIDRSGSATGGSLEAQVEAVDLPGTGKTLKSRQHALIASYEYLQDHPEAKKSDFLQDVFPENPAEYETAEGWWNAIQPALAELPGVDPPEERGHIWHFLGG